MTSDEPDESEAEPDEKCHEPEPEPDLFTHARADRREQPFPRRRHAQSSMLSITREVRPVRIKPHQGTQRDANCQRFSQISPEPAASACLDAHRVVADYKIRQTDPR